MVFFMRQERTGKSLMTVRMCAPEIVDGYQMCLFHTNLGHMVLILSDTYFVIAVCFPIFGFFDNRSKSSGSGMLFLATCDFSHL